MRRTLIVSLVVIGAVIGGWYLSMGRPISNRMAVIDKEIGAESKKIEAYQEALSRFEDRIREYNRINSILGDAPISFSGKDEVINLYHVLDSLCHRPGYRLNEITPSVEEVIQFLRQWAHSDSTISIPIRIKIEAEYRALAQLVEEVEKSEYFDHVKSCHLYGSEVIYPRCGLDLVFVAQLINRLEMFDLE